MYFEYTEPCGYLGLEETANCILKALVFPVVFLSFIASVIKRRSNG
jgi:hypothetical protein